MRKSFVEIRSVQLNEFTFTEYEDRPDGWPYVEIFCDTSKAPLRVTLPGIRLSDLHEVTAPVK